MSQAKFFNQAPCRKTKQKQKTKRKESYVNSLKISKNTWNVNIYNRKLFTMNNFSKCSEVHFKINFVISEMKVYLVKLFLLNIHEALQVYLSGQASTSLIYCAYLIFFYENHWPRLASSSKKRETWRNKVLVFWWYWYRYILVLIAILSKFLNLMYLKFLKNSEHKL